MKTLQQWALYILLLLVVACKQSKSAFVSVTSNHSDITFNNQITETDSMNPIDVTNIYNGGGVGVGDFNNDGLEDIYFAGNMVSNKLYLNKGDFKFQDVTQQSHVDGKGRWCKGVSVVDINNDGWLDLYVCASMNDDPEKRKNLLYINQGTGGKGIPSFQELSHEYGLDDTTHSTMASFFDYDNDGDLDVYIVVNQVLKNLNPSILRPKVNDGTFPSTGRLYQNNMDSILKHPVFKDVTKQAGLTLEGYGHGVNVADINNDGWKDIYVTNDFIANDILYINNHNGTFTDKAATCFKHTSANGMGQDIVDINNDGLADIIELDMDPEDNYRKKMMLSPVSYQTYRLSDFYGYQYQYVRNTLQLNMGQRNNANDSTSYPVFADIGFYAGIAETDWSWSPLVADFDNDGWRDMIVTNGFPRDVTDHDFIAFRMESSAITPLKQTLSQIPQVKLHSYAFKNQGNCRFDNVSESWGFNKPAFSNGAAYVDLDNDGDLDIVMNNINDQASVYENKQNDEDKKEQHYLSLELKGSPLNRNGLGAVIKLFYDSAVQLYEQTPYRGYLSSMSLKPHFGLGKRKIIDSLVIVWQQGKRQVLKNVNADQTLVLEEKNATQPDVPERLIAQKSLFSDVTDSLSVDYTHFQEDFTDFSIQKLLPHKFSEYGPGIACGDINNDGLDDIIIPGNSSLQTTTLIQDKKGNFTKKIIGKKRPGSSQSFQSMGATLFDADNDGDEDLYITHGGYESGPNTSVYNDEFFINDGKGNFTLDTAAFPNNTASKSCVRTVDFDKDGDLDIFIAGRVLPWNYPRAVSCSLYRNDSHKGLIKFTDVTGSIAPELQHIGLVCDATFTDIDNDNWPDLILAGEWMPLTILKNEKGSFKNTTITAGIAKQVGWWNSLVAGDFDNDGDIDFVAGNLGENSFFKTSDEHPVSIYAKDFDNNQSYDAILSLYLPVSQDSANKKKEFPAHLRDDMIKQMISMRSVFQNYKSYASVTMSQLLNAQQLSGAQIMHANNFKSCYCRNDGNGKFGMVPLPFIAQLSSLNGMVCDDFDQDGNLDIAINTNDFGTELSVGRYDALNGLILKGDGRGNFTALSIAQSGIFVEGNGKALAKLRSVNGAYLLAATQNRNRLKLFHLNKPGRVIALKEGDVYAELHFADGRKQKQTFYSAAGFLSQSSRFISVSPLVSAIEITDRNGQKRNLQL